LPSLAIKATNGRKQGDGGWNKEKLGEENEKTRRGRIKETHKTEIKETVYRIKTEKKKASNKPRIPTLTSLSS